MKKFSYILLILFTLGILFTSCNRKTCPAYSQSEQEQSENHEG